MTCHYANGDNAYTAFMVSECMEFGVSLPVINSYTVSQ